jgi:DNA-binding CsgD family transcriptional regulator
VELTAEGPARIARTLAAAEAAALAGAPVQAMTLLQALEGVDLDPVARGRVLMVQGVLQVYSGQPGAAAEVPTMYLAAARAFGEHAPDRARIALMSAFGQISGSDWMLRGCSAEDVGREARLLIGSDPVDGLGDVVLAAVSSFVLDEYEEAVPRMKQAVEALRTQQLPIHLVPALGGISVLLTTALYDDDARTELLLRCADALRDAGALMPLDPILWTLALTEADLGQLDSAERLLAEVFHKREAGGMTPDQQEMFKNVEYLAWRGTDPDLEAQIERSGQAAVALGFGGAETMARAASSLLAQSAGDYETAYRLSSGIWEQGFLQVAPRELPDVVEAAVFTDRQVEAERALAALARISDASGTTWARAVTATGRALVSRGEEAEDHFRDAVRILDSTRNVAAAARAHLLYGEWLHRSRRKADARFQLRTALEMFEAMGASRYAARARRELAATGADVAEPEELQHGLTSREATVAALAADGATNAEIAASLLLSPHTVDFHLRKVYRKVGVSSRRELARTLRRTGSG